MELEYECWDGCVVMDECLQESLKVTPLEERLRSNQLCWYGHLTQRDEANMARKARGLGVEGYKTLEFTVWKRV